MAKKTTGVRVRRSASPLSTIVRAAIHPAIGVARVGNSQAFFLAPEVDQAPPEAPGFYRDGSGALKRQAQRFRIYGYDANGNVVAELTQDNVSMSWSAHLVNQKAAWYQFLMAFDTPEAAAYIASQRRNATIAGANRSSLIIDGGKLSIQGIGTSGDPYRFYGGFCGKDVYLGEMQTDAAGRLVVLGGFGISGSPTGAPLTNFANSDGWYDDTADGPVTAEVSIAGVNIPVDPAWLVVAPPNYAPNLKTLRTQYDLIFDVFVQTGALKKPAVSFSQHIQPILERMSGLQWANYGFAKTFGYGAPMNFSDPAFLARVSAPPQGKTDPEAETRRQIANAFRRYDRDGYAPMPYPWMYGDAMWVPTPPVKHAHAALSPTQLDALDQWALGNFAADYNPGATPPASLDQVPLFDQPAMLDKAALDYCLADAFHPGCEITWPMRHASMYMAPFRIKHADTSQPEKDYGSQLMQGNALAPDGPLGAQYPGGLTRWMAVPWQTDTASCQSGYDASYDPYLPTFWPARVPNQVLDEPEYLIAVDPNQPRPTRIAAFNQRYSWVGVLPGKTHEEQVDAMVTKYPFMGIVEARPGVANDPDLPPVMQVAKLPVFPTPPGTEALPGAAVAPPPRALHPAPSRDGTFMGRFYQMPGKPGAKDR